MKTLRQVCAATILSLMLALSASAGDIHSPGVASTGSTSGSTTNAPSATTTVILTIVSLIYR